MLISVFAHRSCQKGKQISEHSSPILQPRLELAGDGDVKQHRLVAAECGADAIGQLVGLGHAVGLDAEALGQCQIVELGADQVAAFELLLRRLQAG